MAPSTDPDETDARLGAAARDGDARAFEELVGRHEARVLRVLRLFGVPRQDREDVAQDVFFRIFRGIDGYRPSLRFSSWVYRITVNVAYDYRSRRGRRARGEAPWSEEAAGAAMEVGPGPEDLAVRRDLGARLEGALDELSERERAVFVLREMEGIDTSEVARLLGVTRITVRRHLGRAREHLLAVLTRSGKKA